MSKKQKKEQTYRKRLIGCIQYSREAKGGLMLFPILFLLLIALLFLTTENSAVQEFQWAVLAWNRARQTAPCKTIVITLLIAAAYLLWILATTNAFRFKLWFHEKTETITVQTLFHKKQTYVVRTDMDAVH